MEQARKSYEKQFFGPVPTLCMRIKKIDRIGIKGIAWYGSASLMFFIPPTITRELQIIAT